MSGRMSQTSFMRSMKELHFQGDAKLVWVFSLACCDICWDLLGGVYGVILITLRPS